MPQEVLLTEEGYIGLKAELEYLQKVRRPQVAQSIRQAKDGGDVRENAGYDEAKNEQAFLEGRIATIKAILKNAVIIGKDKPSNRVALGSWVTVVEQGKDQECYQVVGRAEADPARGRISNESPLGRALLGQRVGRKVTVPTPDGLRHFKIAGIK